MTLQHPGRPALFTTAGVAGLGAVAVVLPSLGDEDVSLVELVSSYALVLIFAGVLLYGLLLLLADRTIPGLLFLAAAAGAAGLAGVYLFRLLEAATDGLVALLVALLLLADLLRMLAAACVGFALARRVESIGVALLIAGLATVADLFSVFLGPARALVEENSPALDYLLLIFPTFGYPFGFALGVADFIFLALFALVARRLGLYPLLAVTAGCSAVLAAMLAGLYSGRPLPALPFISLSFILVNLVPLTKALLKKE